MPVTPSFQITHQWMREVKQWRRGTIVGPYNEEHKQMTAAQAAAHVISETTMTGVQVLRALAGRTRTFNIYANRNLTPPPKSPILFPACEKARRD
jgi:hypothetical protein